MKQATNIIALDIGGRRIGVARASKLARLAEPLTTLKNEPSVWSELAKIMEQQNANVIVVGLPRNLDGSETKQTISTREFVKKLKKNFNVPIYFQDEALTSSAASDRLRLSGKKFAKEDIDSMAATVILEDFLGIN